MNTFIFGFVYLFDEKKKKKEIEYPLLSV